MTNSSNGNNLVGYVQNQWEMEDAVDVVQQIGNGKWLPTQALLISPNQTIRVQVVEAGAVDKVLEFLLQSQKHFVEILPAGGGDVPCPSLWMQVLGKVCQDGFLPPPIQKKTVSRIVNNLGGVFQDMSNLEEHTIFGSSDYWFKCLPFFCGLLSSLLTSANTRVGDFLLGQAALKEFLVQVVYLELGSSKTLYQKIEEFSRERDNRMPKPDILGISQSHCAFAIKVLGIKRGRDILGEFAILPISPGHELRMATGLIKLLGTSVRDGWYQGGFSSILTVFLQLYDWGGRLSGKFGVQCVSANLIPICSRQLIKYAPMKRNRYFFENVSTAIVVIGATFMTPIVEGGKQAPIDYNVAAATYQGLFEYCLDICDCNEGRLMKPLEGFLKIISWTAKLPATKKAIRAREKEIRAKLERVKDRLPYLLSCLDAIEKIVDMAVALAGEEENKAQKKEPRVPTCDFCYEKCNKGTTKKCSFCKSITYCSPDCLQLNWAIHQQNCSMLRKSPAAKPTKQILDDGNNIFSNHVQKILLQASLKGFSILYCVVVIDMAEATPLLKTLTPDQFATGYVLDNEVIATTQSTLEQNKKDGSLTVSFVGFAEEGLSVSVLTLPPEAAPAHLAPSVRQAIDTDKWNAAQREVASKSLKGGGLQHLQRNQNLWKASILKSMKP